MKIYIAGKLTNQLDRNVLERIDSICKELGHETFLPHRDVGYTKDITDVQRIFKADILEGLKNCSLVVALLDGLHVGAGAAWELGYAYAKKIQAIGFKTDEPVEEALDTLSAILIASMPIVKSLEELKNKLRTFNDQASV